MTSFKKNNEENLDALRGIMYLMKESADLFHARFGDVEACGICFATMLDLHDLIKARTRKPRRKK